MKRPSLRECALRAGVVGIGLIAMAAGLALGSGSTGCGCDCDYVVPIELGVYEVASSEDWPALVGGVVDVSWERVVVSFVDGTGVEWMIEYEINYRADPKDNPG